MGSPTLLLCISAGPFTTRLSLRSVFDTTTGPLITTVPAMELSLIQLIQAGSMKPVTSTGVYAK